MPSKLRTGLNARISFFAFQDIITSVTGILILVTLILTLYLHNATTERPTSEDSSWQTRLAETLNEIARVNAENRVRQQTLDAAASAPDTTRLREDVAELQTQVQTRLNQLSQAQRAAQHREAEEVTRDATLGLAALRTQTESLRGQTQEAMRTNQTLRGEVQGAEQRARELETRLRDLQRESHKLWLIPDSTASNKEPVLAVVSGGTLVCERFNQTSSRVTIRAQEVESALGDFLRRCDPAKHQVVFYVRPSGIGLFPRCHAVAQAAGFEVGSDAVEENKQILFSQP